MVELLRDPMRQYAVDKSKAIKTQNLAATFGDVAQTANAAQSIIKNVGDIRDELAAPEEYQANEALKIPSATVAALNADNLRKGKIADSPEYEKELREAAAEIYAQSQPNLKWKSAQDIYAKGQEQFINDVVAANIRYASQQRAAKQAAREAAISQRQAQNVQTSSNDYMQNMMAAGAMGSVEDAKALTTEFSEKYDKEVAGVGLPADRQRAKLAVLSGGAQAAASGALLNGSEQVAQSMDYALNNNAEFERVMPDELIGQYTDLRKTEQIAQWQRERAILESDLATTDGARAKELQKSIDDIDYRISELQNNNIYISGEKDPNKSLSATSRRSLLKQDFNEVALTELREQTREAVKPLVERRLGERALEARAKQYELDKERAALGLSDTYDPRFYDWLNQNAQQASMTRVKRNEDGTYSAVDAPMSVSEENAPKNFWAEQAEKYKGYRDEMSKVSPVFQSSYATKYEVARAYYDLVKTPVQDDNGDMATFIGKAIDFSYAMSRSPLTEQERRDYANAVGNLFVAGDERIQELRDVLASGDVGIYHKGGLKGVRELSTQDLPAQQVAEQGAMVRLKDTRDTGWGTGISQKGTKDTSPEYYEVDGFDKAMRNASAEFMTQAVNMALNGASKEDIMKMRNQVFDKAVNDWYSARHVVDLRALDSKLENHQEAWAEIDGILYRYKGRDSIGRPLWQDNSTLNTNRDFSRLMKQYTMGERTDYEKPLTNVKYSTEE